MVHARLSVSGGGILRTLSASSSSWALCFSASCTILSISSADRRPSFALISAPALAPVTVSCAVTARMPLASNAKVTSTCFQSVRSGSPKLSSSSPSFSGRVVLCGQDAPSFFHPHRKHKRNANGSATATRRLELLVFLCLGVASFL